MTTTYVSSFDKCYMIQRKKRYFAKWSSNTKCPHRQTELQMDVGWDIDEKGEEFQHLEVCKDCRASRLVIDRVDYVDADEEYDE